MGKITKIQVRCKDGMHTACGQVALLWVGQTRFKFLLQTEIKIDGKQPAYEDVLTHFESGQRMGKLKPIRIEAMAKGGRIDNREAATILIQHLINTNGEHRLHDVMNSATVIN